MMDVDLSVAHRIVVEWSKWWATLGIYNLKNKFYLALIRVAMLY